MLLACEMEQKLRENDFRGGWVNDSCRQLIEKLKGEVKELEETLYVENMVYNEKAIKECADVANYAMMIADKIRGGVK